ncbi:MAG: hypothetical protein H0T62_04850 [Parachlamydiaceae bacterium]|nr:hypothetical protein [Parachlamydiaceae bacterium]
MSRITIYFFTIFVSLSTYVSAYSLQNEQLVTIHGFLGTPWNMHYTSLALEKEKMSVKHWKYPSTEKNIVEHAHDLVIYLQKLAFQNPGKPIHFLTHSMGGLILRAALSCPSCPYEAHIGKAVLLAPPNQGAVWGRYLGEFYLSNLFSGGKSGYELMTEFDFEHLGQFPDTKDVLVVAGNFSLNPLIDGDNDGTVAVAETYLSTPHKHVILNVGHKTILFSTNVSKLVKSFFSQ